MKRPTKKAVNIKRKMNILISSNVIDINNNIKVEEPSEEPLSIDVSK